MLYIPDYKFLLSKNISSDAKLLYLTVEPLFRHYTNKGKVCNLARISLSKTLNFTDCKLKEAFKELADADLIASHPAKTRVVVNWVKSVPKPSEEYYLDPNSPF